MDNENLRNFMSKDEKNQMDAMIARAVRRKERRQEAASGLKRFQYFEYRCGDAAGKKTDTDRKELWKEEYFEIEIERLLKEICGLCIKHGMCQCACQQERTEDEYLDAADEELPFREDDFKNQETVNKCRQYFQSGRMDMLFNLVDTGMVMLDAAADLAGMSVEEAEDMLQGWITAQRMQNGFLE